MFGTVPSPPSGPSHLCMYGSGGGEGAEDQGEAQHPPGTLEGRVCYHRGGKVPLTGTSSKLSSRYVPLPSWREGRVRVVRPLGWWAGRPLGLGDSKP